MKHPFPGNFSHPRVLASVYSEAGITKPNCVSFLDFLDCGNSEITLPKGETVVVIGASPKRGHLVVERKNHTVHVPFHYLEMKHPLTGVAGL